MTSNFSFVSWECVFSRVMSECYGGNMSIRLVSKSVYRSLARARHPLRPQENEKDPRSAVVTETVLSTAIKQFSLIVDSLRDENGYPANQTRYNN